MTDRELALVGRINQLLRDHPEGSHTVAVDLATDELSLVHIVRGTGGIVMPASAIFEILGIGPKEDAMKDTVESGYGAGV